MPRIFHHPLEIDIGLVDRVYKHVHHADILKLLETARLEMLKAIGKPSEYYLNQGLFLVIAKIEVEYLREVKGGRLAVICEDIEIKGKSILIGQKLLNERGKIAVRAKVESVFLSGSLQRAIVPPGDFLEALAGWLQS